MKIDLVFISHNRLAYTQRALESVLADPGEEFSLTVWDNASTDGTADYLKDRCSDPRIRRLILSPENIGQIAALNEVWSSSQADLLGKLDNDCIVPRGWTGRIARAHRECPELGVIACWHFSEDDFDAGRAAHKIQRFGDHRIFRHPWTCGTGFLLKRSVYEQFGPVVGRGMTDYFLKIAAGGYVNGFYYPLLIQDHMDDPKSAYCETADAGGFEAAKATTVGLGAGRYSDPEGRMRWRERIINNLLDSPCDPAYYVGWRAKIRRVREKVAGAFGG